LPYTRTGRCGSCLLIDEDSQGSLTLWNALRREAALPIKTVKRELADVLKKAKRRDVDWVFIDTPANVSASVVDAIRAARLVIIPCRPGLLDIDAVQETIDFSRRLGTPYAVVLNGAPPKREDAESPVVTAARECLAELNVPVWGGQITHRVSFSLAVSRGEGVQEQDLDVSSCAEIARLWQAIEKSVQVIKGARERAAMHQVAA
jgi:chromosome partitioning protein